MKFYKHQQNKWIELINYDTLDISINYEWIVLYDDDCKTIKGIGLY